MTASPQTFIFSHQSCSFHLVTLLNLPCLSISMAYASLKGLVFSHLLHCHRKSPGHSSSALELSPTIQPKCSLQNDRITVRLSLSMLRPFPAPWLTACQVKSKLHNLQRLVCFCSCLSLDFVSFYIATFSAHLAHLRIWERYLWIPLASSLHGAFSSWVSFPTCSPRITSPFHAFPDTSVHK